MPIPSHGAQKLSTNKSQETTESWPRGFPWETKVLTTPGFSWYLNNVKKQKNYPKVTARPDLAGTYGYDLKGRYIGKPWNQCY